MGDVKNIYFYKHCQQILSRMTDEEILDLKNTSCNKSRIAILYRYSIHVEIPHDFQHKDKDAADSLKNLGNDFYKKRENFKAIECYNQGILICPQTDDSSKKLLSLLIANRSAAFFDLKRYKKSLFSIEYLLDVGFYPEELLHKIYIRKAKCHEEEKQWAEAIEVYEKVKHYLNVAKITDKEKQQKNEVVAKTLVDLKNKKKNAKSTKPKSKKVENAVTDLINLKETALLGRYATAAVDIPVGSVVLADEPFAYCVAPTHLFKNCQFCMVSTNCFIACESCNSAIFCSRECRLKATFHKYECQILQFFASAGVSLNCLLALRMITKHPLEYFINLPTNRGEFLLKDRYETDDYNAILNLCSHNDKRLPGQFVHYSCMVIFIIRLLKQTSYFNGGKAKDDHLTGDELNIATRLLEHLLLLEYNAHEVSEVTVTVSKDGQQDQKTETVGGAIYVNLAFFNHSCEPSIIRYNVGPRMIVKTIRPVKAGDAIYENYGPMYTTDSKFERQEFLESRYCFACQCTPCIENWPILNNMDRNVFKIKCRNSSCNEIITMYKNNSNTELDCKQCGAPNTFMNTLMKLMEIDQITKSAEESFKEKEYEEAVTFICQALKVYYEHVISPQPDIVQLHQRLRDSLVHFGNHRDEPPYDVQFPANNKY